ncbi:MAG TPA: UbiX family flavin prenyltransferase [Alphaproteobacteria bacterium]|nr:UbiX family flavin prenyltransferase [Alphaproteobacteria bacterium]
MSDPDRLVVGISGASGAVYGVRLLEIARRLPRLETHLVVSAAAERTLRHELSLGPRDLAGLADQVHDNADVGAAIASGSFRTRGMIIAPCSIRSLSGIAYAAADSLLLRAADVTLKERRPLVLLVRESPLHLGHLRAMTAAAEAGAIIAPPVPAFHVRPRTLDEIVDHTVGRALDLVGLEAPGLRRWSGLPG